MDALTEAFTGAEYWRREIERKWSIRHRRNNRQWITHCIKQARHFDVQAKSLQG